MQEIIEYCHEDCEGDRLYRPHKDRMRFCARCTAWYHADAPTCIGEGKSAEEVPWNDGGNDVLAVQHPLLGARVQAGDIEDWHTVLRHPIERSPRFGGRYYGEPFTLEAILFNLRDYMADIVNNPQDPEPAESASVVYERVLNDAFEDPSVALGFKRDLEDIVFRGKGETRWYTCPVCGLWI